jgi:hypothetical protein
MTFYDRVFLQFYRWSKLTSIDGRPSLLTTCLLLSATQLLNLLTLGYLVEGLTSIEFPIYKSIVFLVSAGLLGLNGALAFRRYRRGDSSSGSDDAMASQSSVPAYPIISVALFIGAAIVLFTSSR